MAARRQKNQAKPDGELRQSQLVTTFGPGAMVDLVDRSVVIGGLEHWQFPHDQFVALDDARLKRSLLKRLKTLDDDLDLAQAGYFRMPPEGDDREPSLFNGIQALEFPRWFVCKACRILSMPAGRFERKGGRYRHSCHPRAFAVPVRFVAACKRGHLADFPWVHFAHLEREGGKCERPELYLEEESLGDIGRIFVRCANCEAKRVPMNRASALKLDCRGERPWLGGEKANEACDQRLELLVRTASNAYFAQIVSALRLPEPEPDELRQRLRDREVWKAVERVEKVEQLELLKSLQEHVNAALGEFPAEEVVAAIQAERGKEDAAERPLRSAEYERMVNAPIELPGVQPSREAEFAAYRVPKEKLELPKGISGLVVVPELREVRVQVSFSRFDSIVANLQGEYDFDGRSVRPAVLTLPAGNQKWLPAAEVRGEGVFIELDMDLVRAWEKRPAVQERAERLLKAFEAEGKGGEFLGVRFYLLHSLSHLLLTAISLECGYAASAIRERIYCGQAEVDGPDMAAVMLMTGTTGSEGTLGGLVEEGRRIRHHLQEAWDLGRLCSNDPVCAAHDPSSEGSDRRTEGAACHGCLYISESSCERFNRFLDRALVVPTIGNDPELAFFRERP